MPALIGETISTITDGSGAPIFIIYEFFNASDGTLRNATQATSDGSKTGALIVDNRTSRAQAITVDAAGGQRTINVPANGAALTVAQLAAIPPPNGPFATIFDLAGLSPSLT